MAFVGLLRRGHLPSLKKDTNIATPALVAIAMMPWLSLKLHQPKMCVHQALWALKVKAIACS